LFPPLTDLPEAEKALNVEIVEGVKTVCYLPTVAVILDRGKFWKNIFHNRSVRLRKELRWTR